MDLITFEHTKKELLDTDIIMEEIYTLHFDDILSVGEEEGTKSDFGDVTDVPTYDEPQTPDPGTRESSYEPSPKRRQSKFP